MKKLRATRFIFALLGALAFYAKTSLAEIPHSYDDAWWEEQYGKIYDTPQCQEIIADTEKIRAAERPLGMLNAPLAWALGLYFAKGECADPDPEQALTILIDLAERGEGLPAALLAHFYHIKHGANAPLTQSWMERAKNAMVRIIHENWRKNFYQPSADTFQKMGIPFSPQLDHIFSWGGEILSGKPEPIYEFGMALLEHGTNPEDKVLGCRWLYEAEKKGHKQARYRLARQHILGDGIQQAPDRGSIWFYGSVNKDQNIDALIFASELLEKGDIYEKHLTLSYIALLRAQSLGADVTERLESVRIQLKPDELEWAQVDAKNPKFGLSFVMSPDLKLPPKSGIAPRICKFVSQAL